jgi:glycerol-3-phosphate O-acyltransferase
MLMAEVGRVIPALPVSLVAVALLDEPGGKLDLLALKARVGALIDRLAERGAHVHVAHADRDYEVTAGLRMLTLRRIVTRDDNDGLLRIAPGEEILVAYYANAIRHLL